MLNKKRVLIIPIEIFYNLDMLAYKVKKVTQNEFNVHSLKNGSVFRKIYSGTRRAIISQATPDLLSGRGRKEVLQHISYQTDIVVLTYKCARQLALVISDQLDFDEHMLIPSGGVREIQEKYPDLEFVNMNVAMTTDAVCRLLKASAEEALIEKEKEKEKNDKPVRKVSKNKTRKKTTRKASRSSDGETGGEDQASSEGRGDEEEESLGETGGYMGVVLDGSANEEVTEIKVDTSSEEE